MADFDLHLGTRGDYLGSMTSTLATNIRHYRERKNLLQSELAALAGVRGQTISVAETGANIGMTLQTLLSISWGLELQPVELFGFVNTRPRVTTQEYEVIQALRRIYGVT